jgi:hypothetical protein
MAALVALSKFFCSARGEVKDARLVSAYSRDRIGGTLKYKRSRDDDNGDGDSE